MRSMKYGFIALAAGSLAWSPETAFAQSGRVAWAPWIGCWQAVDGSMTGIVCIVPEGDAVRMLTVDDAAVVAESTILPDGLRRSSSRNGCTSTESAGWSADRTRLYLGSETRCAQQVTRTVRGMLAFVAADEWLSVQTVSAPEGTATRSVRFKPAPSRRLPAAVAIALQSMTPGGLTFAPEISASDVEEALNHIDAAAVQEWLEIADASLDGSGHLRHGGNVSVLDQTARISHDVRYTEREVRYIERPVYVRTYGYAYYDCWTPWGDDYYRWRVRSTHIHAALPILIHRTTRDDHRDHYRHRYYPRDRDSYRTPEHRTTRTAHPRTR